jgi:hypothetical protein
MTDDHQHFSDLPDEQAKSRTRDWASSVRAHFANEHQRWGEALFKNLILANTGGVAVVATLMGQGATFAHACSLRWALTFFVVGVLGAFCALLYEFKGITERLNAWDYNMPLYFKDKITFGALYGTEKYLRTLGFWDYFFIGIPGLMLLCGCIAALCFLWS